MTGPDHFREAERLAAAYKAAVGDVEKMPGDTTRQIEARLFAASNARSLLDKAQVHATLALAAATAYPAVKDWCGDEDGSVSRGWAGVA